MDTPGSSQKKKKRDPEKNKRNQKLYRERQYASWNGIEDMKALHRRRYHERMTRMKANGEYEAFRAKKAREGLKRYHSMTEDKRQEVRRKNALLQKKWMQKMKDAGTFEAYKQRLNARRREITASFGRRGVEGFAESEISAACGIHSTSTLAMVGRAIRAFLSPPVVAFGLDRARA